MAHMDAQGNIVNTNTITWTGATLDTRTKSDSKITHYHGPALNTATHLRLFIYHDAADLSLNHVRVHGITGPGPRFENIIHVCPALQVLYIVPVMENGRWVQQDGVALGIALNAFLTKTAAAVPGVELWVTFEDADNQVKAGVLPLVQGGQNTMAEKVLWVMGQKKMVVQVAT